MCQVLQQLLGTEGQVWHVRVRWQAGLLCGVGSQGQPVCDVSTIVNPFQVLCQCYGCTCGFVPRGSWVSKTKPWKAARFMVPWEGISPKLWSGVQSQQWTPSAFKGLSPCSVPCEATNPRCELSSLQRGDGYSPHCRTVHGIEGGETHKYSAQIKDTISERHVSGWEACVER